MKNQYLKDNLEKSTMDIVKAFENKQDVGFEYFVSDDVTGIACFGDVLCFNISDICHDMFTEQPKGLIIDWLYSSIDNHYSSINYQSYCMGLRFEDVEND